MGDSYVGPPRNFFYKIACVVRLIHVYVRWLLTATCGIQAKWPQSKTKSWDQFQDSKKIYSLICFCWKKYCFRWIRWFGKQNQRINIDLKIRQRIQREKLLICKKHRPISNKISTNSKIVSTKFSLLRWICRVDVPDFGTEHENKRTTNTNFEAKDRPVRRF